jgi:hypothetical protein
MPANTLHNYFSRFKKILEGKGVSEEELFDKLFYKKNNQENDFRAPLVDPLRAYKEGEACEEGSGVCYISSLPNEIMLMVLKFTDPLTFSRVGGICKEWRRIKDLKGVGKIYKSQCMDLYPPSLYHTTKNFMSMFHNWQDMMRRRGFLRSDGFYVCKVKYLRIGQNDTATNRPAHEIITYKYLKFFPRQ